MVIFALRHADRRPDPQDDLTSKGVERAALLARMLAETGVSVAFRSDTVRARRTLEPLEQKLGSGLVVKEIKITGPGGTDAHVQQIVDAVRQLPNDTVVAIVSHSNTVGRIVKALGGGSVAIEDHEFDKLFVLVAKAGSVDLLRLRYGAAT